MAAAIEADQLRAKAREAIRAGKLPTGRPLRIWARCFAAWDIERRRPLLPGSDGDGGITNRELRPDQDDPS